MLDTDEPIERIRMNAIDSRAAFDQVTDAIAGIDDVVAAAGADHVGLSSPTAKPVRGGRPKYGAA